MRWQGQGVSVAGGGGFAFAGGGELVEGFLRLVADAAVIRLAVPFFRLVEVAFDAETVLVADSATSCVPNGTTDTSRYDIYKQINLQLHELQHIT